MPRHLPKLIEKSPIGAATSIRQGLISDRSYKYINTEFFKMQGKNYGKEKNKALLLDETH